MHVVSYLSKNGIEPESLAVSVEATRSMTPPSLFESIHLKFLLQGAIEETVLADAIQQAVTVLCPISASFMKVAGITWEHHIGT